jgi:hypothetical protein
MKARFSSETSEFLRTMLNIGTAMRISNSKITAPLCLEDGSWESRLLWRLKTINSLGDISTAGCLTTLSVPRIHSIEW